MQITLGDMQFKDRLIAWLERKKNKGIQSKMWALTYDFIESNICVVEISTVTDFMPIVPGRFFALMRKELSVEPSVTIEKIP